jgi:hypothetical protein
MSEGGTAAMQRIGSGAGRVARAWRALPPDRRVAAVAALGLLLSLFLPWYQETVITGTRASTLVSTGVTLTGWDAFGFVEAVILLVAASVLALLFVRAEGRGIPLPEHDGTAILAAGAFAAVLIVYRIFDKQGTSGHGQYATAAGIDWGIIFALVAAMLLSYAGSRVRAAAAAVTPPAAAQDPAATRVSSRRRPNHAPPDPAPPAPVPADPAATRVSPPRRPSSLFGPPVLPDDPPTMRLDPRERRPAPPDGDPPTQPLDGRG